MKLLFVSNLKGNRNHYERLVKRSTEFDAMFWVGDLIDMFACKLVEQRTLVQWAAAEIEAQGCRVFANGGDQDYWAGPWLWLERQGRFVAPGFVVTAIPAEGAIRANLAALREATWEAGVQWIVLTQGQIVPSLICASPPENVLFWPHAALRYGPDIIVTSAGEDSNGTPLEWCRRVAHTYVLTPGGNGTESGPSYVTLDTNRWIASRHSPDGIQQNEVLRIDDLGIPAAVAPYTSTDTSRRQPTHSQTTERNFKMRHRTIIMTSADHEDLSYIVEYTAQASPRALAELSALQRELARAEIVEPDKIPTNVITMNSRAELLDLDTGERMEFTVVFPNEANIDEGRISVLAPLGTAMLGYRVGDKFKWAVPYGVRRLEVTAIHFQPEAAALLAA